MIWLISAALVLYATSVLGGSTPIVFPALVVDGSIELVGLADNFNNDESFRVRLSMASQVRVSCGTFGDWINSMCRIPQIFHIVSEDDRSRRFTFGDPTAIRANSNWPFPYLSIGIGPGSEFLEQADSVSVSRNPTNASRAFLGLGFSEQEFVGQTCVPGSAFRTVFNPDDCLEFTMSLRDDQNGYEDAPRGMYETCFGLHSTPPLGIDKFMTMPYMIVSNLTNRILHWGANRQDDNRTIFTECDASIVHHLPNIVVSFFRNSRVVGSIVLTANDYLKIDDRSGTCQFRFRSVDPATESMFIDPLRIPFVNVHLTQMGFVFCDSV